MAARGRPGQVAGGFRVLVQDTHSGEGWLKPQVGVGSATLGAQQASLQALIIIIILLIIII